MFLEWTMYQNILIPTDGSELSDKAVRHGIALAKTLGAKVTAVTVTQPFHVFTMDTEMLTDTGEALPGSSGQHVFILVADGTDAERFLRDLHARCWLCGFGWLMVGAGGQLLDRSIVDRMVGAPERLVFEGSPVLDPPLAQDQANRQPTITEGAALDTITACPPLTMVEEAKLRDLRSKETNRL